MRKFAGTDALGQTFRLAGSNNEWVTAVYLCNEVSQVEGIRIVIIKQEDHREGGSFLGGSRVHEK
mgnify:FL=1